MATEKTSWLIDIESKIQEMEEGMTLLKRSIYKLPESLTSLNEKAYKPQTVSFGPYHHGEPQLMKDIEFHKQRALLHFVKRSGKPLQHYMTVLEGVLGELMKSYESLDQMWCEDHNRFLELMLHDGFFMLEVLRMAEEVPDDYALDDPIFSSHGQVNIMPHIRRDMLMLENQLPMLLLKVLLGVETGKFNIGDEFLNRKILRFLAPNQATRHMRLGRCLHMVDIYRRSLLEDTRKKTRPQKTRFEESSGADINLPAAKLHEAGIRFKSSKSNRLTDISFHKGVLKLPVIVVDDTTESIFLNLMAFERFHLGVGKEVTSYMFFMDSLIDTERDVNVLHYSGIIINAIANDKAVAKLFNTLTQGAIIDPESGFAGVHRKMNEYYRNRWNEWRANLIHTYFKSPWTALSLLIGFYVVVLATIQTVYAVYQYYHPK